MTTLAYSKKEGVIAIDGRVTSGGTVVSDKDKKYEIRGDKVYFTVGGLADSKRLIDAVEEGYEEVDTDNLWDCYIIMASNPPKEIYVNENGFIESVEITEDSSTYGSGSDHALSALDLGKTAKQAVQHAMTRDIFSGGKVTVYDLNKQKFRN